MKIKIKKLLKENQQAYTQEQADQIRVAISRVMDRTLLKPTLDTNTFADPTDDVDRDRYKWFRDNPNDYIDAYYGDPEGEEEESLQDIAAAMKKHGAIRDAKETTLLYYLYRGVYKRDGKWHIGKEQNIGRVIKEINEIHLKVNCQIHI